MRGVGRGSMEDFASAACHVDGCRNPPSTYWRSCYADTVLCSRHSEIIDMIEVEEIDLSCCWYPFAWLGQHWTAA